MPKTLIHDLMCRDKDLIAPMVWVEGRKQLEFFDTFEYRLAGCMFHPLDPPGIGQIQPFMVDSVGTCSLSTSECELAGVYTNPYPRIPFCKTIRDKGYKVWVEPTVHIYHIDAEALAMGHIPIHHPYSYVPYINSRGEKLKVEQVLAQQFHRRRLDYEEWLHEKKPQEATAVQEWLNKRPLITASYKMFNEASFLPYSLRSIYPYVDCIDIVEGATKYSMRFADEFGASTDGTVELLKKFPDPEHKIHVAQGRWRDREEAQAKLLEMCMGKWMLYIDGDEILDPKSMRTVRAFCKFNQDGKIVYARPTRYYNFWHDFHHIAYSLDPLSPWAEYGLPHAFLVWRDIPGLNFAQYHTIPVDGFGVPINLDYPHYRKRQKVLDDVYVYHFGNAKGAEALRYKLSQPDARMIGDAKEDPWFSGEMPAGFTVERFKGKLPPLLRRHPDFKRKRIRVTVTEPVCKFERF